MAEEQKDNKTGGLGQSSVPAGAGIPDGQSSPEEEPVKVVRVGDEPETPKPAEPIHPDGGDDDPVRAAQKAAEAAAAAAQVAAKAAAAAGQTPASAATEEPEADAVKQDDAGSEEEAAENTDEGSEEQEAAAEKKSKKKKKKKKKRKKEKKPKEPRPKVHMRDIPHLLFPEHIGDIFVVAMIFSLAIGAGLFWLLAWIPTNEAAMAPPQQNIQQFSDEELEEIITILENREEASKAPVVPPGRDPFN